MSCRLANDSFLPFVSSHLLSAQFAPGKLGRPIQAKQAMSISNSIRAQIPPIHPEGYPFIGGFALASLILFWLWTPLGWIGTVLTIWCALFFRDPIRVTPQRDGLVVAPADGKVSMVTTVAPPHELGLGAT